MTATTMTHMRAKIRTAPDYSFAREADGTVEIEKRNTGSTYGSEAVVVLRISHGLFADPTVVTVGLDEFLQGLSAAGIALEFGAEDFDCD